MTCSLSCPDWRLRCILVACLEESERLSRIDEDIDRQERIRAIGREIDERIQKYLVRGPAGESVREG
jgi:hypothetical protein